MQYQIVEDSVSPGGARSNLEFLKIEENDI